MDEYLNLGREFVRAHFADPACENNVSWMYLDIKDYVTIGIGHLLSRSEAIESRDSFSYREKSTDLNASAAKSWEKVVADEYDKVKGFSEQNDKLEHKLGKSFFKRNTHLVMSAEKINSLFDDDVQEKVKTLRRILPDVDSYPYTARLALLDLVFNGALRTGTPLFKAAKNSEWGKAAELCHRSNVRQPRNDKTKALFQLAAMQKGVVKAWDDSLKIRPRALMPVAFVASLVAQDRQHGLAAPGRRHGLATPIRRRTGSPPR